MGARRLAFLTITTAARRPGAAALLAGLRRWHAEIPRHCLVVDPPEDVRPGDILGLDAVPLRLDQGSVRLGNMRHWYSAEEYAAAVKPAAIAALFDEGVGAVLCLDPSLLLLGGLDAALAALAEAPMLLLPLLGPGDLAGEVAGGLLAGGGFLGGCVGLADTPAGRGWLGWWQARLLTGAGAEPVGPWASPGQGWLNFAPGLVPGLHVLHEPAYGLCAGNRAARGPVLVDGVWQVAGVPLRLLDGRRAGMDGPFALCPPPLADQVEGFGQLADGRVPGAAARAAMREAVAAGRYDPGVALPVDAPEWDAAVPEAPVVLPPRFDPGDPPPWPAVSELVAGCAAAEIGDWLGGCFSFELPGEPAGVGWIDMQSALLWERRADLRRHFRLRDAESLLAFLGWSLTRGVLEGGIDSTLFGAEWLARLGGMEAGAAPACLALRATLLAPRPQDLLTRAAGEGAGMAQALWFGWVAPALYGWPAGLAAGVRGWLDEPGEEAPLSRGLAGLWRLRADLQAVHDIATPAGREGLLGWAGRHLAEEYPAAPGVAPAPPQPAARRVRLLLTGQWSQPNGRGEDVRATAAALAAAGERDFLIVDRDQGVLRAADGSVLPPGPVWAEVNIVHCNADSAFEDALFLRRLGVGAAKSVGYWAWELEWLPRWWRHAFGFYDEIWAASRFAYEAFAAERLRPVRLRRLAVVPPAAVAAFDRAAVGVPAGATLFLASFDYRSFAARKNPEAVIAAFRAAFPNGDEPAWLLLKTQSAAHDQPAVHRLLRAARADRRIVLWDRRLAADELAGLLGSADVYVSLHRSEGFGRGPAEALGAGLAVIATDYGGTRDFLDAGNAALVPAGLVTVSADAYVGVDGQRWAEPDVAAAAVAMAGMLPPPPRRVRAVNPPAEVGGELLAALRELQESS